MYLNILFFSIKTINTYLKLEIGVVCRKFLAFKYVNYVFIVFYLNPYDYLY